MSEASVRPGPASDALLPTGAKSSHAAVATRNNAWLVALCNS